MSILQISRIQVRRGLGIDLPQLASGEIGWAVDEQKLFIGNGSVAEGAPYVGNTEILTEHSNIIDQLSKYQYKGSGNIITGDPANGIEEVSRSFQDRLDEQVSVRSFGVFSDIEADRYSSDVELALYNSNITSLRTIRLQRAIDQLYLKNKSNIEEQLVLEIPAGTYSINQQLKFPANVSLKGAGKNKTIIKQISNCEVFYTISNESTSINYVKIDNNYTISEPNSVLNLIPKNINISDLTFQTSFLNVPVGILYSTKDSIFQNVKFEGVWQPSPSEDPDTNEYGVKLISASQQVNCSNNLFKQCEFNKIHNLFQDSHFSTQTIFDKCKFTNHKVGLIFDGSNNIVSKCTFDKIYRQGIIFNGLGNLSTQNKFLNVGQDNGILALYPIIQSSYSGNVSELDYFERALKYSLRDNPLPYIGEFSGHIIANNKFYKPIELLSGSVTTTEILLQLSAFSNQVDYKVDYIFQTEHIDSGEDSTVSTNYVSRSGTLYITYNKNSPNTVSITDECTFNGDESLNSDISFNVYVETRNLIDCIIINYTRSASLNSGTFNYWIQTIS